MNRAAYLCSVFALFSVSAFAEPVTTILNNGDSSNRLDIVVLGDGYTAAELGAYAADVDTLTQQIFAVAPYDEYQPYINVHRIDVTSNESGADHPENNEFRDTALGATYFCAGIQRLICVDFSSVMTVINASVNANQQDIILVLVNDPEYGGSGGTFAVASTNASAVEIMLHEIGHSFGFLADEYESSPPACNTTFEPSAVNITLETDRNLIKWNAGGGPPTGWIDPATPIPYQAGQPTDVPGLYDGGGYCTAGEGMYRPTFNSKMRSLGVPYGPINEEQLVKRTYAFVYPIDSQLPVEPVLVIDSGDSQNFSITTPQPSTHSLDTSWYLDLAVVGNGESLMLTPVELTPGPHQVTAWAQDITPFVRNDPDNRLQGFVTWNVFVATVGDRDGDLVADVDDAFPDDPFEQFDFDGDLIGDNADPDDDNDSVLDVDDAFPFNAAEWVDTDGDGTGNNADIDDDNDGMPDDWEQQFSLNPLDAVDADDDPDDDGFTNLSEFLGGTDPTDKFSFPSSVYGDLDYDGKADVLWRNSVSGRVDYWQMNGPGILATSLIAGVGDHNWQIIGNGDYTGGGKADVLWRNIVTGRVDMWEMNGPSITRSSIVAGVGDLNWQVVASADFTGDGKTDILWRNMVTGRVDLWEMNRANITLSSLVAGVADLNWQVNGTGDVTGDGKADVVWRNMVTGRVDLWEMNGPMITQSSIVAGVGDLNWQIQGIGDVTGDNKDDVVWRNVVTGRVDLWEMNGPTITLSSIVAGVGDLNYQIMGIYDYNGDGKHDVLWRNVVSGRVDMWEMNGPVIMTPSLVAGVADLNWQVLQPD